MHRSVVNQTSQLRGLGGGHHRHVGPTLHHLISSRQAATMFPSTVWPVLTLTTPCLSMKTTPSSSRSFTSSHFPPTSKYRKNLLDTSQTSRYMSTSNPSNPDSPAKEQVDVYIALGKPKNPDYPNNLTLLNHNHPI